LDRFKKGKGREFSRLLSLIRAWDIREYYIKGKVDLRFRRAKGPKAPLI
jgi:hypothetical protein